jgi:hypothetical protein
VPNLVFPKKLVTAIHQSWRRNTQFTGHAVKTTVKSPKPAAGYQNRCQEMHIYPTETETVKLPLLKDVAHLLVLGLLGSRQGLQQPHDLVTVLDVAAGQFVDHEGMDEN